MNSYEKILKIMEKQAKKTYKTDKWLGIMKSSTECSISDVVLDKSDLLKSDGLDLKKSDVVLLIKLNEKYIIIAKVVDL